MPKSAVVAIACLGLATVCGCTTETVDPATMAHVTRGNILAPALTEPHPDSAHVMLIRVPGALGYDCDTTVQLSYHSVPGGRIVDVAKVWSYERLDIYPGPGRYRIDIYSALCQSTPADVDLELKPGDEVGYRIISTGFSIILKPEPLIH